VHQVKALEILVAMAKKKGRRESMMAIGKKLNNHNTPFHG
jgi:hypothetical protein